MINYSWSISIKSDFYEKRRMKKTKKQYKRHYPQLHQSEVGEKTMK